MRTHPVKVWDIRNQKCIQTITDAKVSGGQTTASALNHLMYDKENQRLFAASSRLRSWDLKPVFRTRRVTSHDASVVSALYNRGFNQVVSADTANNVVVWDAETGAVASQFEIGDPSDPSTSALTAMTFDQGGRRLVTGSHKVRATAVSTPRQLPIEARRRV